MNLLKYFFNTALYVQISPERLTVRDPKSGQAFSEIPELAIAHSPKATIIAFGAQARLAAAPGVEIVNPFNHPRTLVGDFTSGEQLLKAAIRKVQGNSFLALAPRIVIHLLGDPAGGFTQVEARAFHEMALGAGAREVDIWQGRTLTDEEVLSRTFPAEGKRLS
jgi:rod shape-determining protein MreB and related proteins